MTARRVADLMQTDILTLAPDVPIRRAVALLVETRSAAAPVVGSGGALVGILTQKDCFRPSLHASYHQEWTGTVADHMSADVVTLDAQDDVMRAAEMFLDQPHRAFPVLDDAGVAGLLERSDVLAFLSAAG